jgi:hypothetical protein
MFLLKDPEHRSAFDDLVFVSNTQRAAYLKLGLDGQVIRNAPGPEFFCNRDCYDPLVCPVLAYTSMPYRGLKVLLDLWPIIRRKVGNAELRVFSGHQIYQSTDAEDDTRWGNLWIQAATATGVTRTKPVSKVQLAAELKKCHVFAYPCTFAETSCLAMQEAMAAGCLAVTTDLAALAETGEDYNRAVPFSSRNHSWQGAFVDKVVEAVGELRNGKSMAAQCRHFQQHCTWAARVEEWEQLLGESKGAKSDVA